MAQEQIIIENPAQRLHTFLVKFDSRIQYNSDIKGVLQDVFSIENAEVDTYTHIVADLWLVPTQLRNELSKIPGLDAEAFRDPIAELEIAMTYLSLNEAPQNFSRWINRGLLQSLTMMSAILNKDVPQHTLSEAKQKTLIKDIEALIAEVRSADYDFEFKMFVIQRLEALLYALTNYDTLGTTQIIAQVDQLFGSLLRQAPSLDGEKKRSLARRLIQIGGAILIALELANQTFQLAGNADILNNALQEPSVQQVTKNPTAQKE